MHLECKHTHHMACASPTGQSPVHPIQDAAGGGWAASWLTQYGTRQRRREVRDRQSFPSQQGESTVSSPNCNSHRVGNLAPLGTLFFFPIWQLAKSLRNYFRERRFIWQVSWQTEQAFDLYHVSMSWNQDEMSFWVCYTIQVWICSTKTSFFIH